MGLGVNLDRWAWEGKTSYRERAAAPLTAVIASGP